MAKVNFTAGRVAAHSCPEGKSQAFIWDADTPGLGLRATAAGAKAYIFQSKFHGATVRVTIGSPDVWPLESQYRKVDGERQEVARGARPRARELQSLIDRGIDPREHAAEQRAADQARKAEARRQDVTLSDAWNVYLEERRAKWSDLHYRDHVTVASVGGQEKKRGKGLTEPGPLAPLLPLRLSELNSARINTWLSAESENRPARARLAFNLLRIFAGWCESKPEYRGLIDHQALSTRIAKDVLPRKEAKTDALQREQLKPWFEAVAKLDNPIMQTYLIGLLITGARREELAELQWADVDFRWRTIRIKDKIEKSRVIPLTPYYASLLQALKLINDTPPSLRQLKRVETKGDQWEPSKWAFSSPSAAEGRLTYPNAALNRVCEMAEIPPVTLHGLRRSFSSLSEWVEVPTGVVAQIMGHRPSATAERHYKVRPIDLLRKWHESIENWILNESGIEFEESETKMRAAS